MAFFSFLILGSSETLESVPHYVHRLCTHTKIFKLWVTSSSDQQRPSLDTFVTSRGELGRGRGARSDLAVDPGLGVDDPRPRSSHRIFATEGDRCPEP